ncbi:hypothetical protein AURDEDRAFT_164174 [Auricularia subglabra TFB-10046 SS5]|nr:hypothetical protein AURDEDRAFT_164174 [Auricularia subglabra TFB-10046 SS5]
MPVAEKLVVPATKDTSFGTLTYCGLMPSANTTSLSLAVARCCDSDDATWSGDQHPQREPHLLAASQRRHALARVDALGLLVQQQHVLLSLRSGHRLLNVLTVIVPMIPAFRR